MGIRANIRERIENKKYLNEGPLPEFETDGLTITLRELMKGLQTPLPARFEDIADEPQTLAFRAQAVKPGDVCVIIRAAEEAKVKGYSSYTQYKIARENGAKLIIQDKKRFLRAGGREDGMPAILVNDMKFKFMAFVHALRAKQKGTVLQVTGSIGKTTTKDFCGCVAEGNFKTYYNRANPNSLQKIVSHLFKECNKDYEVYIQETGAGYPGSVRLASRMVEADVFILTNVYNHHLQMYHTFDNLFMDKTSADDVMKPDGIIITNFDDENIRKHPFKHTVKSFGIKESNVEYRGINIVQDGENLKFDVLERSTGIVTPISIEILGEHNVYNALAAFAFGRVLGLTGEQIRTNFLNYKTKGVRQKLVNIGGVYIDMDCYNVAEESIMAMLNAGENFDVEEGARKIALVGGENKLGKDVSERSLKFGEELADIDFDKFLFCGRPYDDFASLNRYGDGYSVWQGFKKASKTPCEYCNNLDDMTDFLLKNVRRGDLLMVKGIYQLDQPIAVDRAFGTSFSFGLSNYIENMKTVEEGDYKGSLIEELGAVELTEAPITDGVFETPLSLAGYKVFRIDNRLFLGRKDLRTAIIRKGVKNIGNGAFRNCRNLFILKLPFSLRVIESRAFEDCRKLKVVVLRKGVSHIGDKAFKNCKKLRSIVIPPTVGYIGKNAFEGDDNLVIRCQAGSYAHLYAKENGIKFEVKEEEIDK